MEENKNVSVPEKELAPKKKGVAIILCLLTGWLGGHKFYEGKYVMGILYLVTFGFMGIGMLIDLVKLLGKPSVYYVEKKTISFDLESIKQKVVNFRLDIVGKVVSGLGGAVIGLGASAEWNLSMMLVGVAVAAVGVALTWLKTGDIRDTLISNAIIMGVVAVGTFVFALLVAAVIVYIVVKIFLGIDLIEFLTDIFGSNDKKRERTEQEDREAALSSLSIPDQITGPYGHTYHRVSSGVHSSEYASDADGSIVTIHDSDIGVSAMGMYADTSNGHFYW